MPGDSLVSGCGSFVLVTRLYLEGNFASNDLNVEYLRVSESGFHFFVQFFAYFAGRQCWDSKVNSEISRIYKSTLWKGKCYY